MTRSRARHSVLRASVLAAAFAVLLTGCAGTAESPAPVETGFTGEVADAPTADPVTTPSPAAVILQDAWVDNDGYSFEFEFTTATPSAAKDLANAKPGEAIITWEYEVAGEIKNTTPERNATVPTIAVQPVWPAGSAVCGMAVPGEMSFFTMTHGFSYPQSDDEGNWCTFTAAPFRLGAGEELSTGSSAIINTLGQSGNVEFVVPEANADAILAELLAPPAWALGRDKGPNDAGVCSIASGRMYVSKVTVDAGCGV